MLSFDHIPRLEQKSEQMRALDNLCWTGGIIFECFGVKIGVRVNDTDILPSVTHILPPRSRYVGPDWADYLYSIWKCDPAGKYGQSYTLFTGPKQHTGPADLDLVLERLSSSIDTSVAIGARDGIFVHAGAVRWCGRGLIIPGSSKSGKTTLVSALIRAGAAYYSDEYAVLDYRGRVHPFPRPLSLRTDNGTRRLHCASKDFGAHVGRRPIPLGLIVVSRFKDSGKWAPTFLSPGESVLALLGNTVAAQIYPSRVLPTLSQAACSAAGISSERGEADEAAASILEFMKATHPKKAYYTRKCKLTVCPRPQTESKGDKSCSP